MTEPTITTEPTDLDALWVDDAGMILCGRHSHYLYSAILANPTATVHRTPLGTWERMTKNDLAYLADSLTDLGYVPGCESGLHKG